MVLVGHALGDIVGELQEPVVELAEVAEHERADVAEVVAEVPLAPPRRCGPGRCRCGRTSRSP